MSFVIVIPARYGSIRFPGKPLAMIRGKTMIQRVYERAIASDAEQVVVATDDQRIAEVVSHFGGNLCMTCDNHTSGTARIGEVISKLGWDDDTLVINVQGDEPLIPTENINSLALAMLASEQNTEAAMATLCYPITDPSDLSNSNVVKLVMDAQGRALYFSRAPIPYSRDGHPSNTNSSSHLGHRHIGIYAYRARFVKRYLDLPACELEQLESLEQLRVLYHGYSILVQQAPVAPPHGIDTPEDLNRLLQLVDEYSL